MSKGGYALINRGPFRTKNSPKYQKIIDTRIVHTSGAFFENIRKNGEKHFWTMFLYTVEYTESEYDIQNNNLLYKLHQKCKNAFELLENSKKKHNNNQIDILYFI